MVTWRHTSLHLATFIIVYYVKAEIRQKITPVKERREHTTARSEDTEAAEHKNNISVQIVSLYRNKVKRIFHNCLQNLLSNWEFFSPQ